MTKSIKSLVVFASLSLFAAGLAFAAAAESKTAGCCAKASKAGEKCGHECCVAAAGQKPAMNCEKCKGSGPIVKKKKKAESQ
jgi:hypothetical protein